MLKFLQWPVLPRETARVLPQSLRPSLTSPPAVPLLLVLAQSLCTGCSLCLELFPPTWLPPSPFFRKVLKCHPLSEASFLCLKSQASPYFLPPCPSFFDFLYSLMFLLSTCRCQICYIFLSVWNIVCLPPWKISFLNGVIYAF